MARKGGKKNLSKLVPIKKNVIDHRSNSSVERTYYIDPNKDKTKVRNKKNRAENESGGRRDKLELSKNIKSFDDFAKEGIDPEAAKQFFCNL